MCYLANQNWSYILYKSLFSANNEQPGKTFIEEMTQKNFLPIDPVRDKMKMSVKWSEEYKEAVVVLVGQVLRM